MEYTPARAPWPAVGVHAAVSLALFFGPLVAAAHLAAPGTPLFGGLAAVLAPLYYAGVFVVMVAPSLSVQSAVSDAPTALGDPDGAVGRLQRRYVEGDLSEAEFERRLERLLEE